MSPPQKGGPTALTREQRLGIAREIADKLRGRYQDRAKAIALFGSVARGTDGPYSDVELFCVLVGTGIEEIIIEWSSGPWKAQVNMYSEDVILRDAGIVDGTWPLVQSGYVYTEPLFDPDGLFASVREVALKSANRDFGPSIRNLIVGEIWEAVGKVRNARERKQNALPMLTVEIVKATACLIGLSQAHMYVSNCSFLEESLELLDRPAGYDGLCKRVLSGDLGDPEGLRAYIDRLWTGIEVWAEERDIRLNDELDPLLPDV
jgi:kanamycin nucleotidyltransferase